MSAARVLDVAPLARLVARPRAILSWVGLATLVSGLGSLVVALKLQGQGSHGSDAEVLRLFASVFLVVLPASVGMLASEAAFEVLRRPTTFLLPGLRRRLRRSALVVAPLTAFLVALCLAPLGAEASWIGAFALALLGFAAGTWAMARVGGGGVWLLRVLALGSLAYLADTLGATLAARPLLAAGAVFAALLIVALRFHPRLLRAHLFSPVTTMLAPLARGRAKPSLESVGNAELEPPAKLGGSLAGWTAALKFERRTVNPVWGLKGFLCFVAYTYVLALIGPALITLFGNSGSLMERVQSLPAAFLGIVIGLPQGSGETEVQGSQAFLVTIGVFAGFTASLSSTPLLGSILYPVSRTLRARLAFALGVRTILLTAAVTLVLGAVLGLVLTLSTGQAWPRVLPIFVWIALVNLLLAPWILMASHAARRTWGDQQGIVGTFVLMIVLITGLLCLGRLQHPTTEIVAEHSSVLALTLYVAVFIASLLALREFLSRSYARRDLVHRRT